MGRVLFEEGGLPRLFVGTFSKWNAEVDSYVASGYIASCYSVGGDIFALK